MKIGIDIDGVLADFCTAYEALHVEVTGRNTFAPYGQEEGPVTWNWPVVYGYTKEETAEVWNRIKSSDNFNMLLKTLPDARALRHWRGVRKHDVYFVTARVGERVKWQTEEWLQDVFGYYDETPTVLIASDKGAIAKALNLDIYVDDNWHNAYNTGVASPTTQVYLIDRAYNRPESSLRIPDDRYSIPLGVANDSGQPYHRIKSLMEALPQ